MSTRKKTTQTSTTKGERSLLCQEGSHLKCTGSTYVRLSCGLVTSVPGSPRCGCFCHQGEFTKDSQRSQEAKPAKKAKRHTVVKKHGGDDEYSWAVINKATGYVHVAGCSRMEAQGYQKHIEKRIAEEGSK